MKKLIIFILIIGIISFFPLSNIQTVNAEANVRGVVLFDAEQNDEEITITATLKENKGVSSLLLTLNYDLSVMKLSDVDTGSALSEMSYIETGHDGSEGYAVPNFKFHWLSNDNQNCTSTGILLKLKFKVVDDAEDGKYLVTLKYDKESDVSYYEDNTLIQGDFVIDKATVTISNGKLDVVINETDNTGLYIIIASSIVIVACIVVGIIIIYKRKKVKKGWKKINEQDKC